MTQFGVGILDHWTTQRPQRTNFVPPRVVETVSLGVGVSSLSAVNAISGSLSYKNFAGISQPITIQNAPFSPTISTAGVTLVMEGINYPQVSIPNVAMPIPVSITISSRPLFAGNPNNRRIGFASATGMDESISYRDRFR